MSLRLLIALAFATSLTVAACRHAGTAATKDAAVEAAPSVAVTYENERLVLRPKDLGGGILELRTLVLKNAVHGKIPVEALKNRAYVQLPPKKTLAFDLTLRVGRDLTCKSAATEGTPFLGTVAMQCVAAQSTGEPEPPSAAFDFKAFCTAGGGVHQAEKPVCLCPGKDGKPRNFLEKDAAHFREKPESFKALCAP